MPWEFTDHHVRPNVFYWSPKAHKERNEVKNRREQAQDAFVKAKKAIEDAQYESAELLLQHSLAAWPDNSKYALALGHCIFLNSKDALRSLPWYDECVRLSDTPAHRAARARARAADAQLPAALEDMEVAIRGEPESGELIRFRGLLYARCGEFFEACQSFTAAIALFKVQNKSIFECLFNRGYCQRMMGNVDLALQDLEQALLINTTSMTVRTVLGQLYLSKKRYARALDCFLVVKQQQNASAAAANNAALAAYMTVMCEFDDSSAATRAASMHAQVGRGSASGAGRQTPSTYSRSSTPTIPKNEASCSGGGRSLTQQVAQASAAGLSASRRQRHSGSVAVAALLNPDIASDHHALQIPDVVDIDISDDEEGPPGSGQGQSSSVYASEPRQWALDQLKESSAQSVTDDDQRAVLETAVRHFTEALKNAEALRKPGADAHYQGHARRAILDPDTYAVAVCEGGDIPHGLLLVLSRAGHTPGTAVVHDREIEDGEIQYGRGLACLALGRLAEAGADLDEALRVNPHHAHYPYYQAVVSARKGEFADSIQWNRLALQRNPDYFHALFHLGLVLHVQGQNSEAIQRLDRALGLAPKDWRVMEARGRVLQELDRHAEALPALQDALQYLDPGEEQGVRARLHFALAQSAVAAHLPELLRSSLREARLNGQDPASVYNLRGMLARKERQFAKALQYLGRALRQSPREARFYFDRAQAYVDMQRWPQAIDDLSSALELLPDSALLLYNRGLANLSFAAGDAQLAVADLEAAAAQCTGTLRADGALWEGSKFLSSGAGAPDLSPSLWYHLGCARARVGQHPESVEAFERAVDLMPGQPSFLHELAKACQACGRTQEAVDYLSKVTALQPGNARAYLRRGLAYRTLKQYEAAASDLQTAKRLEPHNPLLQLDYKTLGSMQVVELCRPGEEDDKVVHIT